MVHCLYRRLLKKLVCPLQPFDRNTLNFHLFFSFFGEFQKVFLTSSWKVGFWLCATCGTTITQQSREGGGAKFFLHLFGETGRNWQWPKAEHTHRASVDPTPITMLVSIVMIFVRAQCPQRIIWRKGGGTCHEREGTQEKGDCFPGFHCCVIYVLGWGGGGWNGWWRWTLTWKEIITATARLRVIE